MSPDDAGRLRRAFALWAVGEEWVLGLSIIGSWARGTARSDSDLDVLVLTDEGDRRASDDVWLRDLLDRAGFSVASTTTERHGAVRSWRAWIGRSIEVEVTMAAPRWACTAPVDPGTRRVVSDGMQVLVDRTGLLRAVQEAVLGAGQI